MSRSFISVLAVAVALPACSPAVRLPVLQPALVTLPSDVQTIGVIDRSGPKNVGQGILGTIEGVVTGEGILVDREGARQAVASAVTVLADSPRFEVVQPNLTGREAQTGLFDDTLDYAVVRKICRQAGCDALLALEAFDSDSFLNIDGERIVDGRDYGDDVTVSRDTRVLTSWRLYDADEDRLLDEMRSWGDEGTWDSQGEGLQDAIGNLPSLETTVYTLGNDLAWSYGYRIAPSWVTLSRSYYGGGSKELKEAKHYVQAGDWDGARLIWSRLLDDSDPKVRGKAQFNLALASEVEGDLLRALDFARDAAVSLHNGRSREYVAILSRRIDDQSKLQHQMMPPTKDPTKVPGSRPPVSKPPVHGPSQTNTSNSGSGGSSTTMSRPQ